jgi:hypothetical protein
MLSVRAMLLLSAAGALNAASPACPAALQTHMATAYASYPASAFAVNGAIAWNDALLAASEANGTQGRAVLEGGLAVPGLADIAHNFNLRPPCSIVGPL